MIKIKTKNNLIIYGGLHSKFFPNTKNSKYKVYASCLDYHYCLKEYKNSFYKKYAVFVDAGISYHPDQKFAKEKLQLNHGKTEAWIILDAPAGAKVGIGFKNQMAKKEVAALVSTHDSTGLLNSLEFKQVRAGDAVFVPAGVPHAIESGIFVLELQEPTDLSILLEWDGFAVDGDKDGHLNLGFDTALDALRLDPLSDEQQGQIISRFESSDLISHGIFKSIADNFFRADYLTGDSRKIEPGFGIFLALAGNGVMRFSNADPLEANIGDAIVIPYSAGELSLENCAGILSRPPAS